MPGARLGTVRYGDNFELLTEFILRGVAFTTRVPRQEDIGYDFFCVLAEPDDKLLKAGPFFTVQAKSKCEAIVFEKAHEVEWIKKQDNPLFICVSDTDSLSVNIYSTWIMHMGFLGQEASKIILMPGGPNDDYEEIKTKEDRSEQFISLGKPVLHVTAGDVMDRERMATLASVLRDWVLMDRENMVNRSAGLHWIIGPRHWETNRPLPTSDEWLTAFYWNAQNLVKCLVNFGRSATALRLTIRWAYGPEGEGRQGRLDAISKLDNVLRSYSDSLEPLAKKVLLEVVGLDLSRPAK